ncbi:uncharacterized protein METZ01_LOCUS92951 [marine metagenome]|uniref:Mannosyltransferase n=1 Tax=marine metagenome TaxID=408172 RepID=A0A381VKA0_9ZZZZ
MKINIVSFDIPYPPDYGGVIDIYYKIKALNNVGIKIYLHCFHYGRKRSFRLESICSSINYYRRYRNPLHYFSKQPFIVRTRTSKQLINNLLKNDSPILFEGLHSCFYLTDPRLKNRKKIVRTHNVEHKYYYNIAQVEQNWFKKKYFISENRKLRKFEKKIGYAEIIAPISESDTIYFSSMYSGVVHVPIFHGNETVNIKAGKGDYALYHGNLSVPENENAALYLVHKVFNDINVKLIISGRNPSTRLLNAVNKNSNVTIETNIQWADLLNLINNAQINILPTSQNTGMKLKLINALYNGRHCIVNSKMITDKILEECCIVADSAEEMKKAVLENANREMNKNNIVRRTKILENNYSNKTNADNLISIVY